MRDLYKQDLFSGKGKDYPADPGGFLYWRAGHAGLSFGTRTAGCAYSYYVCRDHPLYLSHGKAATQTDPVRPDDLYADVHARGLSGDVAHGG